MRTAEAADCTKTKAPSLTAVVLDLLPLPLPPLQHRMAISAPTIHEETYDNEHMDEVKVEHDDATIEFLKKALSKNPFTGSFSDVQREAIAREMMKVEVKAEVVVMLQGERGDRLYVTGSGTYETIQNGVARKDLIGGQQVIGEMAILYKCLRTATIRSKSPGTLYYIDLRHFHHVLYVCASKIRAANVEFLKGLEMMSGLCDSYLEKLSEVVVRGAFNKGNIIYDETVDACQFYIVMEGEVLVLKGSESVNDRPTPVCTLYRGAHFGSSTMDGQSACSIYKVLSDHATVLILDRIAFTELIAPLEALGRIKLNDPSKVLTAPPLRDNEFANVQLAETSVVGTLGAGGFGRVDLIKITGHKKRFALKRLSKAHILQNSQEEHVLNEKRVLEVLNSIFCVKLEATFKDSRYVYLMMESCLGGELWIHLKRQGRFREGAARFYVASVVEAIAYLHSLSCVYRDLKPENIMLDLNGYVKIVDFGFAKKMSPSEKTWTFCGTPDYMAPEIVMNQGHSFGADLWSLGILVFELLCGRPPFSANDPMDM